MDKKEIEEAVAKELKDMQAIIDKANSETPITCPRCPTRTSSSKSMTRSAERTLSLRIHGQNIWVLAPGKLTRYDRDTGKPLKEIPSRPAMAA